jgi:hypothetical protein
MLEVNIRTLALALAAALGAGLQPGREAAGQVALGTQLSRTEYVVDQHSWGPGVRGLLKVPFTGLTLQGTYDSFRMPCGPETCRHRDLGFALLWSFPLPLLVDPYVGVGVAPVVEEGWKLNWDVGSTGMYALGAFGSAAPGSGGPAFSPRPSTPSVRASSSSRQGSCSSSSETPPPKLLPRPGRRVR